jgi:hypothetical protein
LLFINIHTFNFRNTIYLIVLIKYSKRRYMLSVDANRFYYSELPSENNQLLKNRNESFSSSDVESELLAKSYSSNVYDWFEPDCDQPWLFENINETECIRIFLNYSSPQREGTFLISRLGKNYTLYFIHFDADGEQAKAPMSSQICSNIYNIKIDSEFKNCQRSLWLELNQTRKFDSIAELVSYYSQNCIETSNFSIKLADGIDKEKVVKFQTWLTLDMNSNEVDNILSNSKKKGCFLIRKSSAIKSLQSPPSSAENGVMFNHVYTLVANLNSENRLYRFKIYLQREGNFKKYKILNNEFSSLLDLVNYYRVNPIYENQVLTEPPCMQYAKNGNDSNKENDPSLIKSLRSVSEAQVIE